MSNLHAPPSHCQADVPTYLAPLIAEVDMTSWESFFASLMQLTGVIICDPQSPIAMSASYADLTVFDRRSCRSWTLRC